MSIVRQESLLAFPRYSELGYNSGKSSVASLQPTDVSNIYVHYYIDSLIVNYPINYPTVIMIADTGIYCNIGYVKCIGVRKHN